MLKPCEEWNEQITAWLDQELTGLDLVTLKRHLRECDACRTTAELYQCDEQDACAALRARGAGEGFADGVMQHLGPITPPMPVDMPAPRTDQAAPPPAMRLHQTSRRPVPGVRIFAWATAACCVIAVSLALHQMLPPRAKSMSASPHIDALSGSGQEVVRLPTPARAMEQATTPHATIGAPASPPPQQKATIIPPMLNYGLANKILIAYKGYLSLENDDVQGSMEQAEMLFNRFDGFVLTSDFQCNTGGTRVTVAGRVPAEKLGAFLIDLDRLGKVVARQVQGEDLTAQELGKMLKQREFALFQQNLTTFQSGTGAVASRVAIEERRHAAAEEANGTRVDEYLLRSRVKLADMTVEIVEPARVIKTNPYRESAAGAWRTLCAFGRGLVTLLIPVLIWTPVWVPLLLLAILLARRWHRTRHV